MKYKSKTTKYRGKSFPSKAEAAWCKKLDEDPEVMGYAMQPTFFITAEITWKPDFIVWFHDGRSCVDEVKGFETPDFKLKLKLWQEACGLPDLRVIKRGKVDRVVSSRGENDGGDNSESV